MLEAGLFCLHAYGVPRSLLRGFHACSKIRSEGENSEMPRLLAAGIGIFRVLPLYLGRIESKLDNYSVQNVRREQITWQSPVSFLTLQII